MFGKEAGTVFCWDKSQSKQNLPQQQVEDVNNPQLNVPISSSDSAASGRLWFLEILSAGGIWAAVRKRKAQKEKCARRKAQGGWGIGPGCQSQVEWRGKAEDLQSKGKTTICKDVLCEMKGRPPLGSSSLCRQTQETLATEKGTFFLPYPTPVVRRLPPGLSAEPALECLARLDRVPPEPKSTDWHGPVLLTLCLPRLPSSHVNWTWIC